MTRAAIPEKGRPAEDLLTEMESYGVDDVDFKGGRTWSMVYWAGDDHHAFLEKAHNLYMAGNALNPMAFKSLKRFEAEVVQMTASMLHGPESAVGTMTSGGTESILMAVKAYRDEARRKWPWIVRPQIVAPVTVHPAFDKACHYFGLQLKKVPVDADGIVDPRAMERAISRRTVLLVASAPQYAHGVVDPIPEIGAIAARRGLPLHVDACFGGFMLPWLERLGVQMPTWDFRVQGVTSISADLHKYGFAAKGASVVVYRDMDHLRHQFYVSVDWPGGIYASPSMAGTRPGGAIAAAWAALMVMGEDRYMEHAEAAWDVAERLRAGIDAMEGLRVMGRPMSTIVTWTSTEAGIDVYAVADQLVSKGWSVDRQQKPPSVHLTCNASNAEAVDTYLADLKEAVAHVRAHPELADEGEAAMYGLMSKIPIKGLVAPAVRQVMEQMYAPGALGTPDLSEGPAAPEGALGKVQKIAEDLFRRWNRARSTSKVVRP